MRVRLKGLNRVKKRLADGSTAIYYHAWKGGPRLPGKPGEPAFIAAFNAAANAMIPPKTDVLNGFFDRYQDSLDFRKLADNTHRLQQTPSIAGT